ncbi:hypothetical protein BGX38DRAFT_891544 [Terfezia claveryi]|nr:hypothetical protein BGX38DRAFT_891544 [Terfezia claveryi]
MSPLSISPSSFSGLLTLLHLFPQNTLTLPLCSTHCTTSGASSFKQTPSKILLLRGPRLLILHFHLFRVPQEHFPPFPASRPDTACSGPSITSLLRGHIWPHLVSVQLLDRTVYSL